MRRSGCLAVVCVLAILASVRGQGREPTFLGKTTDGWLTELKSAEPGVRRSAAFALGKLGQDAPAVIAALLQRLADDSDDTVRDMAALALGDLVLLPSAQVDADRPVPLLRKLLRESKSKQVRRSAAFALGA